MAPAGTACVRRPLPEGAVVPLWDRCPRGHPRLGTAAARLFGVAMVAAALVVLDLGPHAPLPPPDPRGIGGPRPHPARAAAAVEHPPPEPAAAARWTSVDPVPTPPARRGALEPALARGSPAESAHLATGDVRQDDARSALLRTAVWARQRGDGGVRSDSLFWITSQPKARALTTPALEAAPDPTADPANEQ
jgi:hypothetical protein